MDDQTKWFDWYGKPVGRPLGPMVAEPGFAFSRKFEGATVHVDCTTAAGSIVYL